jgi:hypothetical protein
VRAGREIIRLLVDYPDTVIEGEVIVGKLKDGQGDWFDLGSEFAVKWKNGACSIVHGWLVNVGARR